MEALKNQIPFALKPQDLWRAHIKKNKDGVPVITIDVHGMSVAQAERAIRNLSALRGEHKVAVIHGYNHGTAIRDSLESFKSRRMTEKYLLPHNPGETMIAISAA